MNKKRNFLNNLNISKKIILFIIIMNVSFMVILYLLVFRSYTDQVYDSFLLHSRDRDSSALTEIIDAKNTAENTSNQILSNSLTQHLLSSPIDGYYYQYSSFLTNQLNFITDYNDIVNVIVGDAQGKAYTSNLTIDTNMALDRLLSEIPAIYEGKLDRAHLWLPLKSDIFNTRDEPMLYLARDIYSLNQTSERIGYSIIQYDSRMFSRILERSQHGEGEYRILINQDGQIIGSSMGSDFIGSELLPEFRNLTATQDEGLFTTESDDKLVLVHKRSNENWSLYHVIPRALIIRELSGVYRSVVFTAILQLLIASIIAFLIAKSITNPVRNLVNTMNQYGKGQLKIRSEENRTDEIGNIQVQFNDMADRIEVLLDDVRSQEKEKQQLKYAVLQYQINPHFLYNTLDSINWMAQSSNQTDISMMVTALARFFRISLKKNDQNYTVNDELEHALNYLKINQFRYNNQFDYIIVADEEIRNKRCIQIILQPVLENFFKHAFSHENQSGFIRIEVSSIEKDIEFRIIDNGVGMSEKKVQELNYLFSCDNPIENEETQNIGLINVNRRIRMYYGNDYGISVESIQNIGTKVIIRIGNSPVGSLE